MFGIFRKKACIVRFDAGSEVRAIQTIQDGNLVVSLGSTGIVLRVFGNGNAYEVQFTSPQRVVAFVAKDQLASAQ